MTLRRTIAAALRTGALMSANVALARVRQWERDDSVTPDRLARLSGINRLVDACRSVADLLDPHPTAASAPRDGGGHEPAPPAPVVASDEQAVRAAGAAGEDGGHEGEGSTDAANLLRLAPYGTHATVTRKGWRVVVEYVGADGLRRGIAGYDVQTCVDFLVAAEERRLVKARDLRVVKGGRA